MGPINSSPTISPKSLAQIHFQKVFKKLLGLISKCPLYFSRVLLQSWKELGCTFWARLGWKGVSGPASVSQPVWPPLVVQALYPPPSLLLLLLLCPKWPKPLREALLTQSGSFCRPFGNTNQHKKGLLMSKGPFENFSQMSDPSPPLRTVQQNWGDFVKILVFGWF